MGSVFFTFVGVLSYCSFLSITERKEGHLSRAYHRFSIVLSGVWRCCSELWNFTFSLHQFFFFFLYFCKEPKLGQVLVHTLEIKRHFVYLGLFTSSECWPRDNEALVYEPRACMYFCHQDKGWKGLDLTGPILLRLSEWLWVLFFLWFHSI